MAEKEVKFGKRIILISYRGKYNGEIAEFFVRIIEKLNGRLSKVMDRCGIPKEINLNFKRGRGELDGIYHVQGKDVIKHLIAIDVFTDGIKLGKKKEELFELEKKLVDTFVHEIVHHKYAKEGKTREITRKIADNLIKKFIDNSGRYKTICPELSNKTISKNSHIGHKIVYIKTRR